MSVTTEPCGGCGEPDPKKACIGCLHFHAPTTRETADHAELARLAEAATPGPWLYRDMTPNTYGPAFVDAADVQSLAICGEAVGRSETHGFCLQVDSDVRMANAAFIAAANPATIKNLLSEIAALRGDLTETRVAADLLVSSVRADLCQAERQRDEAVGLLRELWQSVYYDMRRSPSAPITLGTIQKADAARAFLVGMEK